MLFQDILIGFAFFLIIEGLVYALAPSFLVAMAKLLPTISESALRVTWVASIALGVGLVWLVHG